MFSLLFIPIYPSSFFIPGYDKDIEVGDRGVNFFSYKLLDSSFFPALQNNSSTPHTVYLVSPLNNTWTNEDNNTLQFIYNHTGALTGIVNCTLFIDGIAVNDSYDVLANVNIVAYSNQSIQEGVRYWNVSCFNGTDFDNSTTFILNVDRTPPLWLNNSTSIPSTYDYNKKSYFNISWLDNGIIDTVYIEGNWSGLPQNYTMFSISPNIFSFNDTLPAGTFYWKSYARDKAGNWNVSDVWVFTINKAVATIRLFLNGTEGNKYYSLDVRNNFVAVANFTVTINTSYPVTVYLDTNITGWSLQSGISPLYNITQLTSLGVFNITGYFPGDNNYTASSQTYYAFVQNISVSLDFLDGRI
jgi:hypothetical protein